MVVFVSLAGGPWPLQAQVPQARLLYDEGGMFGGPKMASIRLTDANGEVPPDTAAVRADSLLHFVYRPEGDWSFADDAPETLRRVVLQQGSTRVRPERVTLRSQEGDHVAARVSYPRATVDWLAPIAFAHEVDTSAVMSLPDVYAASYPALRRPYDRGQQLIEAGHPLRALDTLSVFYGDVSPAFGFVSAAKATLDTAAAAAMTAANDTFQTVRNAVVSTPSAETLGRLRAFQARIDSLKTRLQPYLSARPDSGAAVQSRLETLEASASSLYGNAYDTYRRKTLRLFMRGTYDDPTLAAYLHGLTRLLLAPRPALQAEGVRVDTLSPARLEEPRYADLRRRLQEAGSLAAFREVVSVINVNIRERSELFGDEAMQSLRLRRPAAPQPYYEIMAAMNAILADDPETFETRWARAVEKVTDLHLLHELQRWRIASETAPDAVPRRARALTDKARRLRADDRLTAAQTRLQRASGLAPDYAPLHYERGRLHQALGDTSSAQALYERARTLSPRYVPPAAAQLRLLLAQQRYEQALTRADSLVQQQSYWLFYFPKARALAGLDRPSDARQVMRGRCEPLNNKSYALYTVLAETYVEMESWKGVRWAVQQARPLTPDRAQFERRLDTVRTVAREEGVALQKRAADTMSTDAMRDGPDGASPKQ